MEAVTLNRRVIGGQAAMFGSDTRFSLAVSFIPLLNFPSPLSYGLFMFAFIEPAVTQ